MLAAWQYNALWWFDRSEPPLAIYYLDNWKYIREHVPSDKRPMFLAHLDQFLNLFRNHFLFYMHARRKFAGRVNADSKPVSKKCAYK